MKVIYKMEEFTKVFKALSDKTRLRIIYLLCGSKTELCVCELVDSLEEPQYNISRHLKILKNAGLIRERKEGRWVYYGLFNVGDAFKNAVLQAVSSIPITLLSKDKKELKKRLKIRVKGKCLIGIQKKHIISRSKNYGKR